jgi:subtilisin-like proprotein convertase family protein
LGAVISNNPEITEVLPTYSRDLTFRFTVRDNHTGAGGIATQQVNVKATAAAGPFLVLSPNSSGTVWKSGEQKEITWDVANTDVAPVNCKLVNVKLSTDGGLTFPISLATNVPNNGRACVTVPNNLTSNGRIMVEAADNVFFDLSNTNLTIQNSSAAGFTLCSSDLKAIVCLPGTYTTTVSTRGLSGFGGPVTLDVTGLPSGATASFSPNPVAAGSDAVLTVNFVSSQAEGVYNLTVNGTSTTPAQSLVLNLKVVQNNFAAFSLKTPANGASGVDLGPILKWNAVADANSYQIQVASNPSFDASAIISERNLITVDTFKVPVLLSDGQTVYWRVRPVNECNNANWSEPFVFVTKVQSCNTFTANDLPKAISSNGTPTIESKIVVNSNAILSDVNITNLAGNHDFLKDLDVKLVGPTGVEVQLWKDKCPGSYNFKLGMDDSAPSAFACPPPTNGNKARPTGLLSSFNGLNAAGTWILRVKDVQASSGGSITGFQLELCSSQALNAPFLVNNKVLSLPGGTNEVITSDLLKVDDADNTPAQLIYTLITVPEYGALQYNGATLKAGDQFSQEALNNGLVRYFDYGVNAGADQFRFAATDGNGGLVADIFKIQPIVGTKEASQNLSFALSPNPASQSVQLFFGEALSDDTQVSLLNVAGQIVHNWQVGTGNTTQLLELNGLPGGIYVVTVRNAKGKGVQKLVIR